MNNNEKKQLQYFPKALDEAVNKRFEEHDPKCESTWGLFSGNHTTVWREDLPESIHIQIKLFVEGYMAGNLELRERISNPDKWI